MRAIYAFSAPSVTLQVSRKDLRKIDLDCREVGHYANKLISNQYAGGMSMLPTLPFASLERQTAINVTCKQGCEAVMMGTS